MALQPHVEDDDRINTLPDDLLLKILCLLSLKEAVATSAVCRRWRYLWTLTNKLDLRRLDMFCKLDEKCPSPFILHWTLITVHRNEESNKGWSYARWVDHVLRQHTRPNVDELKIDFFLSESHKSHIDRWLWFASCKKVKSLVLKLKNLYYDSNDERYSLPLIGFQHLRRMHMEWVNVSGEGVEFLLKNCPLLEELSISLSLNLTSLTINVGPSLKLRILEIRCCKNLTSLEIREAANLECFMYQGRKLEYFSVRNTPRLLEMHVGGDVVRSMRDFLSMLSVYVCSRLEKLTIDTTFERIMTTGKDVYFFEEEEAMMFYNNVTLSNLKQLVVKLHGEEIHGCNLIPLTYFIRASPLLESSVIEVFGGEGIQVGRSIFVNVSPEKKKVEVCHPHLKRVEVIGYRGTLPELDLVVHLFDIGIALEEVVIDLRKRDNRWSHFNFYFPNSVSSALPVGYPLLPSRPKYQPGYPILPSQRKYQPDVLKASVRKRLTKRMPSTRPIRLTVL